MQIKNDFLVVRIHAHYPVSSKNFAILGIVENPLQENVDCNLGVDRKRACNSF